MFENVLNAIASGCWGTSTLTIVLWPTQRYRSEPSYSTQFRLGKNGFHRRSCGKICPAPRRHPVPVSCWGGQQATGGNIKLGQITRRAACC